MKDLNLTDIRACVFNAYGTLFDVNSAAQKCKGMLLFCRINNYTVDSSGFFKPSSRFCASWRDFLQPLTTPFDLRQDVLRFGCSYYDPLGSGRFSALSSVNVPKAGEPEFAARLADQRGAMLVTSNSVQAFPHNL